MKALAVLLVALLSLAAVTSDAAPLSYLFGGKITSSTMGAFGFSEVQVQVAVPLSVRSRMTLSAAIHSL
ncbi:hypothetical protein [Geobacter anodireducens]